MITVITEDESTVSDSRSLASAGSSDDGLDEKQAKEVLLVKNDVKKNRVWMVIFHFIVAYPRWSVSLFLFLASLSVPLLPSMSVAASLPYESLQVFVDQEAQAYYQCNADAFDNHNKRMVEITDKEYQNVLAKRQSNQVVLEEANKIAQECSVAGAKAREALYNWTAEAQPILYFNASNGCTDDDRNSIADSLGQENQEVASQVTSVMGDYVDSSQSSLGHIQSYARKRMKYDYNYFLRDRIHPVIELLKKFNVSADVGVSPLFSMQFSVDPKGLLDDLLQLLQPIEDALKKAKMAIDILMSRLQAFHESIEKLMKFYDKMYERVAKVRDFIVDMHLPFLHIPDWLTVDDVPLSIELRPIGFEIPNFSPDILDIDILIQNFETGATDFIAELLKKLEEEANQSLYNLSETLVEEIRDLLVLKDYNPPKYQGSSPEISSPEEEANYLSKLGETAESKTKKSLEIIQGLRNASKTNMLADTPKVEPDNFSFSGNTTTFDYQKARFPAFSVPELLSSFLVFILNYQWIFEMVIQLIRLWRLKNKYEVDATPDLPEIDFGTVETGEQDGEERLSGCLSMVGTILQSLFSVWMMFFIFCAPFLYFGAGWWYPQVQTNCVDTRNGTVFANAMVIPFMVNQANAPGNALYIKNEFSCRRKQRQICDQMYANSNAGYQDDAVALSKIMQKYNESTSWTSRLDRCIDTVVLDLNFSEACCGLEGYLSDCALALDFREHVCPIDELVKPPSSYRPVGEYISEPACHANNSEWILKDARFDCQALEESCSVAPCTGVDEELIEAMSIEADCLFEMYLIRYFTFFIVVLYHAMMINLFCTLLFNGLKHLLWRKLKPDGIKLKTQVDENGDLVKGTDRKERADRIAAAIRRFELQGWLQLAVGAIFFLFWLISFSFLGKLTFQ